MKHSKILCAVLALVMVLSLCACGGSKTEAKPAAAAESSLADIQKSGKLVMATSPDFPPFEELAENGTDVVGIEVDILKAIAEKLGVELVIEQIDFDSVLPGVQAKKFNVGVSGITVTEERQKNADFSVPYFMASQAIVVTKDSPIASKADLEGKKVSVQTGTTAEEYCMSSGYTVEAFVANNDAASALTSGKVDAWVVDNEVAIAFASDLGLVVLDEAMTSEPYGFAFAKGSDSLVAAIDEIINAMIDDGSIQAVFDSYGVPYVSPKA